MSEQQVDPAGGAEDHEAGPGGLRGAFGPLTGLRVAVLATALCFLVGAVAFVVGEKRGGADPLSSVDVGFMVDMGYHHEQAVQMSVILLAKEDIDSSVASFAQEVIIDQQFELGVFNALLDRYGHSTDPGETAMGWMGSPAVPLDSMDGLATDEQIVELQDAEGAEAEALWIALMSRHHLGGLHMADHEARYGSDATTVNLARAIVKNQRSEIVDYQRLRVREDLPIPEGFDDPLEDQRLNPLSYTDGLDDESD